MLYASNSLKNNFFIKFLDNDGNSVDLSSPPLTLPGEFAIEFLMNFFKLTPWKFQDV